MQFAYIVCAYVAGVALDLLVIAGLLRVGYGSFPLLLLYVIIDFLTTIVEIPVMLGILTNSTQQTRDTWATIYWWNERVIQVLVFLIVIGLIFRATERWRPRRPLLAGVIACTLLFAGVSLAYHFDE